MCYKIICWSFQSHHFSLLLYGSAILILFQFFQNTFILDLYNHVFSLLEILAHVQFLFGLLILIFNVSNQNLLFPEKKSFLYFQMEKEVKFWVRWPHLCSYAKHELLLIMAFIMLYFKCVITSFSASIFRTETMSVCFPFYPNTNHHA